MKTSRYTEAHILAILRQAEGGMPVADLCREHRMSSASFYKWRAKYGGMDASLISQMKAIEEENRRLKRGDNGGNLPPLAPSAMQAGTPVEGGMRVPQNRRRGLGAASGGSCTSMDRHSESTMSRATVCWFRNPLTGRPRDF